MIHRKSITYQDPASSFKLYIDNYLNLTTMGRLNVLYLFVKSEMGIRALSFGKSVEADLNINISHPSKDLKCTHKLPPVKGIKCTHSVT